MGATMRVVMMIGMVASLVSIAHAATGTATFYTPPYVRKFSVNCSICSLFIAKDLAMLKRIRFVANKVPAILRRWITSNNCASHLQFYRKISLNICKLRTLKTEVTVIYPQLL